MRILIVGASGQLGSELHVLFPDADCPTHDELDITNLESVNRYLVSHCKIPYDVCIHCAALINQNKIEHHHPEYVLKNFMIDDSDIVCNTINTNIIGTGYLSEFVAIGYIKKIVYISTEYIYKGNYGNYSEDDDVFPVNRYGWSKLAGEGIVRQLNENQYLIIRCAFSPKEWHRDVAFTDAYSSREPVNTIAKKISILIINNAYGVYNIGQKRKSIWKYATSISPNKKIEKMKMIEDISGVKRPQDSSLNTKKYKKFITNLKDSIDDNNSYSM